MAYIPTPTRTGTSTNLNPAARGGAGAFGQVPGAIQAPNPFADLSKIYPNLSQQNNQVSGNIMNELKGELSPETMNAIQDSAAAYGISSGMPGSGLAVNRGLRDLGLATEQLQGKGLQDYLSAITGISGTQTVNPALQTQIAEQNAVWNAAPDPRLATQEQLDVMQRGYDLENPANPNAGQTFSTEYLAGGIPGINTQARPQYRPRLTV